MILPSHDTDNILTALWVWQMWPLESPCKICVSLHDCRGIPFWTIPLWMSASILCIEGWKRRREDFASQIKPAGIWPGWRSKVNYSVCTTIFATEKEIMRHLFPHFLVGLPGIFPAKTLLQLSPSPSDPPWSHHHGSNASFREQKDRTATGLTGGEGCRHGCCRLHSPRNKEPLKPWAKFSFVLRFLTHCN